MASINTVNITGNLTRDPELRMTNSGTPVLMFSVAVNDRRKNVQTGEWEDYPNYIDCTMFGARAESVSKYIGKGTKVAVMGKLRWSQWEKDGQKRSKISVIAEEIEFMSAKREQATTEAPQEYQQSQAYQQPQEYQQPQQFEPASVYDEDIPF